MVAYNAPFVAFNQGLISAQGIARVDQARNRFAAEQQDNWMPRAIGSMMLRPGLGYLDTTKNNLQTYALPFVFDLSNSALIEMVDTVIRMRVNESVVTRVSVATAITSGDFSSSTGWTQTNTSGASSSISGGVLTLSALAVGSTSTAYQAVTVAAGDQNKEHALRIVVTSGPVILQIGTTSTGSDVVGPYTLGTGTHSLAFTPTTGTIYVQLFSTTQRNVTLTECSVEAAGIMELPAPWPSTSFKYVRAAQSADVMYLACSGYQQQKLERRGNTSWSIVLYAPEDGPFLSSNVTDIQLTPNALSGDTNLVASRNVFNPKHVGALFRVFSQGQTVSSDLAASNVFTSAIRVTGVGASRSFNYSISGSWAGSGITLQRSFDSATSGFVDVQSFAGNASAAYSDGLDNSIVWYRIGFEAGAYTSGTASCTLQYVGGGAAGVARVTGYTSPTVVSVRVLSDFANTTSSTDWNEGSWSDYQGWPSAVTLYQGRLWWFGQDKILGSVSDAFESYDYNAVGDSAPLNRTIGYGPVANVQWGLALQRLILGLELSEASIRSTAFDEPITPTNFSVKDCSTQGSDSVAGVKVDARGYYVQRSARKIFELLYSIDDQDYISVDMTAMLPDLDSDFVQIVVQRQPDTRIHCLRADGTVLVLLLEVTEKVVCWYSVSTPGGTIENMAILPSNEEDRVYYYINRNGTRTIEKMALISECQGGTLNKQADCFIAYTGTATTTISGIPTLLNGQSVVVWGDGKYQGTFTVSSGTVTLTTAVSNAVVGLSYTAQFKSAKLAFMAQKGTALNQKKRISGLGLVLYNTHAQGLEFGQDFTTMDNLPLTYLGAPVDTNTVYSEFDQPSLVVPGKWDTDSRLCLRATAPKPATLLGCSIGIVENEH